MLSHGPVVNRTVESSGTASTTCGHYNSEEEQSSENKPKVVPTDREQPKPGCLSSKKKWRREWSANALTVSRSVRKSGKVWNECLPFQFD